MKKKLKNYPLVSVVMCTYNRCNLIYETIKSVLNQTYKNFEFIIINDCSTDNTISIIQNFMDSRIILINNETNLGPAASANIGMKIAKGKYIARMDDDDICIKNRLYEQVKFMEKHKDIGISGAGIIKFNDKKRKKVLYAKKNKLLHAKMFFESPFAHPVVIYRTEEIRTKKLYYDPSLRASLDYDFFVNAAFKIKMANINKFLLYYRMHNKSISKSTNELQQNNALYVRKKVLAFFNISASDEELNIYKKMCYSGNRFSLNDILKTLKWFQKIKIHIKKNKPKGFTYKYFRYMFIRRYIYMCLKQESKKTPLIYLLKVIKLI